METRSQLYRRPHRRAYANQTSQDSWFDNEDWDHICEQLKGKDEGMVQRLILQANGWMTLDGLLSGIVMASIIFGRPLLQVDNVEGTVQALRRISVQLENLSAPPPSSLPLPPTSTPSPTILVTSGALMAMSLTLGLMGGLNAMMMIPILSARIEWVEAPSAREAILARQIAIHRYEHRFNVRYWMEAIRAMTCCSVYLFALAELIYAWTVNTALAVIVTTLILLCAVWQIGWDMQSLFTDETNTSFMILIRGLRWAFFRIYNRLRDSDHDTLPTTVCTGCAALSGSNSHLGTSFADDSSKICDILGIKPGAEAARLFSTEPLDMSPHLTDPLPLLVDRIKNLHWSSHRLLINLLLGHIARISYSKTPSEAPIQSFALWNQLTIDAILRLLIQLTYHWRGHDRDLYLRTCTSAFANILGETASMHHRGQQAIAHVLQLYASDLANHSSGLDNDMNDLRFLLTEVAEDMFVTLRARTVIQSSDMLRETMPVHTMAALTVMHAALRLFPLNVLDPTLAMEHNLQYTRMFTAFEECAYNALLPWPRNNGNAQRLLNDMACTILGIHNRAPQLIRPKFVHALLDLYDADCAPYSPLHTLSRRFEKAPLGLARETCRDARCESNTRNTINTISEPRRPCTVVWKQLRCSFGHIGSPDSEERAGVSE